MKKEDKELFDITNRCIEKIMRNPNVDGLKELNNKYSKDHIIETLRNRIRHMCDDVIEKYYHYDCQTFMGFLGMGFVNPKTIPNEVRYCFNFWYPYTIEFDPSMGSVFEVVMDFNDVQKVWKKVC